MTGTREIPSPPDEETRAVRVPPQSIEAEQSLLGGLLLESAAFDLVTDIVLPEDFYRQDHQLIYQTMQRQAGAGRPIDVTTVFTALQADGKERECGGLPYLNTLANSVPSAANVRRYAEIVRDRSLLRQLVQVGDEITTSALDNKGEEVGQIIDGAQQLVYAVGDRSSRGQTGFRPLKDLARDVTDELRQLHQIESDEVTGLPSGFVDLDRYTAGFQKGELTIIAARPGMGKTTLALNIAEHAAVRQGLVAAIFSLEMPALQLAKRLISSVGRFEAQKLRHGRLSDADWARYADIIKQLEVGLYIDDTQALTVNEIRARARRLKRRAGELQLIVVDYLQLMSGSARAANENRATEISEISRGLKSLAKEMNLPVIALSQLNRAVDSRPNRRPLLSDLRESGAIEQDADTILFLYRDEVYNPESEQKNVAEVIIGKQRNGPTGVIRLRFDGAISRFDALAREDDGA